MAKAKKHPKSHTARLAWVNSRGDLSDDAKDAYKELYDTSVMLRYLTNGASARGASLRDQDVRGNGNHRPSVVAQRSTYSAGKLMLRDPCSRM